MHKKSTKTEAAIQKPLSPTKLEETIQLSHCLTVTFSSQIKSATPEEPLTTLYQTFFYHQVSLFCVCENI